MHLMRSSRRFDVVGIYILLLLVIAAIVGGLWWVSYCVELPFALLLLLFWSRVGDARSSYSLLKWLYWLFVLSVPAIILLVSLSLLSLRGAYIFLFACIASLAALRFVLDNSLYWSWRMNGNYNGEYYEFYTWFSGYTDSKDFTLGQAIRRYWQSREQQKQQPAAYLQILQYWQNNQKTEILAAFTKEYARYRAVSPEFYQQPDSPMRQLEPYFFQIWTSDEKTQIFYDREYDTTPQELAPFAFELVGQQQNLQQLLKYANTSEKIRQELLCMLPLAQSHLEHFMEEQSAQMVAFFRSPQRLEETEQMLTEQIPAIDLGADSEQVREQLMQLYGLYYMAIGIAQNCA